MITYRHKSTPLLAVQIILKCSLLLFLAGLIFCCAEEEIPSDTSQPDQIEEGSWITYSPYKWTHDGKPYQLDYCKVFSDGASDEMKQVAGEFVDVKFMEVLQAFDFSHLDDLRYPTERKEIDVYINRHHPENIAAAYWGSIFITVRSSELDMNRYAYLFKHELTHAFEFLVEGTVNLAGEMWFTEGIAIVVGGGINRINTPEDLELWISKNDQSPNKGNPITIKKWEDYPEGADKPGYTTVFEVVMEYMLDPKGLNKSMQDVLNLFYDLRGKMPFEDTFEKNFEISVMVFEEEIFDRLRIYLDSN